MTRPGSRYHSKVTILAAMQKRVFGQAPVLDDLRLCSLTHEGLLQWMLWPLSPPYSYSDLRGKRSPI